MNDTNEHRTTSCPPWCRDHEHLAAGTRPAALYHFGPSFDLIGGASVWVQAVQPDGLASEPAEVAVTELEALSPAGARDLARALLAAADLLDGAAR